MATPIVGADAGFFAALESAFDTTQAFVTTDAVLLNSMKLTPSLEYHKSKEHAGSASLQTEIEGKRGGKWEAVQYVKPNAAGSLPGAHPFLKAGFGTHTVSASTSVTYSLTGSGTPSSLQLSRYSGTSLYDLANGAWVEQLEFEVTGNQEPTIKASGGFASYGILAGDPATTNAGFAGGVTAVALGTSSAYKIRPGARVKFGTEDNAGAGYLVTAVSSNGITLTISPALANAIPSSIVTVTPVKPTAAPAAGTIQGGIACGLSIDSTAVGFISYKLTYGTGYHGLDKEANTNRTSRVSRGARSVEGEIQFYFLDENAPYLVNAWNGATHSIVCRVGPNTAASRMSITTLAARLEVAEVDIPEMEEAVYTAKFVARKSSANEDELTVAFD